MELGQRTEILFQSLSQSLNPPFYLRGDKQFTRVLICTQFVKIINQFLMFRLESNFINFA